MGPSKPLTTYLDNAATTAVSPEIVAKMSELMLEAYGNPSSRHELGLVAERALRGASERICQAFGVPPQQLIVTGSASEALALAVHSAACQRRTPGHVLVGALEHPAVGEAVASLAGRGHEVEAIPADLHGRILPEAVFSRLRPETFLVAVMMVNNELGAVSPVAKIARGVKRRQARCLVLCDMVQGFSCCERDFEALQVDFAAISAHKLHGPKGVGCLAFSRRARISPLWVGGGQQRGLRGGTEDVAGAVALAMAVEATLTRPDKRSLLSDALWQGIRGVCPEAYLLGTTEYLCPHIRAVAFPGFAAEVLVNALGAEGVFVSSGSACHSRKSLKSPALAALGVPEDHAVLRFSVSHHTRMVEIDRAVEVLAAILAAARQQ